MTEFHSNQLTTIATTIASKFAASSCRPLCAKPAIPIQSTIETKQSITFGAGVGETDSTMAASAKMPAMTQAMGAGLMRKTSPGLVGLLEGAVIDCPAGDAVR
jgi:hypothetical protein